MFNVLIFFDVILVVKARDEASAIAEFLSKYSCCFSFISAIFSFTSMSSPKRSLLSEILDIASL